MTTEEKKKLLEQAERELIEKDILRMFYANFGIPKHKRLDNEIYYQIYDTQKRYNLVYGGRGSGKSFECEGKLPVVLIGCLPFCRVMMIRQVYNSIKGSQFQEVIDYIDKWDLYKYFDVFKSPMKIVHKESGNYISFAGMDKPQSLKSMKDYTHVIFGEAFQIHSEEGVSVVDKSIRTPRLELDNHRLFFVFNPDNKNHWLHETFFEDTQEAEERFKYHRENSFILKTTYRNNKFVDKHFISLLEAERRSNPERAKVDADGNWGDIQKTGLFYPNFNYAEVVEDNLFERVYDNLKPLYLTFDFNVFPYISLEVSQLNFNEETQELELALIDEICLTEEKEIGKIEETCKAFLKKYHKHLGDVILFGDRSGWNRKTNAVPDFATVKSCLSPTPKGKYRKSVDKSSGKEIMTNLNTHYEDFNCSFKLRDQTIKGQNPRHIIKKVFFERLHSGILTIAPASKKLGTINARGQARDLSEKYGSIKIVQKIDSRCRYLITDYQEVVTDEKGGKSTRVKTLTHTSDAVDYLATTVFNAEFKLIESELKR